MFRSAFLLITALILLVSCDNRVFDKYNNTPIRGWEKNDTLRFSVPKMRQNGAYKVDLSLRINKQYPFMALSLIVEQRVFPGKELKIDTINCKLIDKNGKPLGNGISTFNYDFEVDNYHLNKGDSLYITVRHDMKREILPGISDVGIQIRR